jgi:hypothetical protein
LKDPAPVLEMDRAQLIDQGESPRDFNIQDFSPPKLCDFLKQHAYMSEPRIVHFLLHGGFCNLLLIRHWTQPFLRDLRRKDDISSAQNDNENPVLERILANGQR